jgi:hypothetical protein
MEAASTLTRSLSLSPRARTARFPCLNHCPFSRSAGAASPPSLPLRRARSDFAVVARSAVLLHSPVPPILEALDDERGDGNLLDGAGAGKNGPGCPGGKGGGDDGGCGMGDYYHRVLRLDPENPLLLRNYGTYLHEVERDLAGAEACYARGLLASPGDADLLSLYGRVIWEARQEKERAEWYFERAVQAAPDDWYVSAGTSSGACL